MTDETALNGRQVNDADAYPTLIGESTWKLSR